MASLYDEDWRQGTIFSAVLPLDAVVLNKSSGQPERRPDSHDRWVIATQDCDLDQTETAAAEPTIELRPVYIDDPPQDWGLRSATLRLTEKDYVRSASPRALVSAEVLTAIKARGAAIGEPGFSRRRAFTIWLGKRYDRPAVPTTLGPLAKKIAEEIKAKPNRVRGAPVRDVLVQFDESASPTRYSLYAVLDNEADEQEIRQWLAGVSIKIPPELGVADRIEAATASGISLELIESSFAADVSQVTWRPNNPDPEGAR